ncbi:GAF domain-containing sensor histidine kinase [Paenibacillus senegalensis]|uniref:GAF domain-containing sensor histidine kinase n=1 Tax=Paenibacillus senegalensis TaxID=1465766 RepID=UPI000287F0EE|nr:GAF domain-containing sensor histidine kinase [Paenibacillus senegalensis]
MGNMDLYEQEKRVAEYYATIGRVIRSTWRIRDTGELLQTFAEQIGLHFGWHTAAILLKRRNFLHLNTFYSQKVLHFVDESINLNDIKTAANDDQASINDDAADKMPLQKAAKADVITDAVKLEKAIQNEGKLASFSVLSDQTVKDPSLQRLYWLAIPLSNRDEMIGVLLIGREDEAFDSCEIGIIHDLAEHVALAIDNVKLYEENEQLVLEEERRRLARDLHDSVNQKLFSLSLVAQGLRMRAGKENSVVQEGLLEIGGLAQEALAEMKSLIWGLRSEEDYRSAAELLKDYAGKLGLSLNMKPGENMRLSPRIEEALWRIGQEALNNVKKHAGVESVEAEILYEQDRVRMKIEDKGRGFKLSAPPFGTLGLVGMRERVELLNGSLEIRSEENRGTVIEVELPLNEGGKRKW